MKMMGEASVLSFEKFSIIYGGYDENEDVNDNLYFWDPMDMTILPYRTGISYGRVSNYTVQ